MTHCCYAQKKQRIKTIWHRFADVQTGIYTDSLIFFYTGDKGSQFNFHRLNGVDYGFPYDAQLRGYYYAAPLPNPFFDTREQSVFFDSAWRFFRSTIDSLNNFAVFNTEYYNDTSFISMSASYTRNNPINETRHTYNTQGQLTGIYTFQRNTFTQALDTVFARKIVYDNIGRAEHDTIISYGRHLIESRHYTYDSINRAHNIYESWQADNPAISIYNTTYTYDTAGNIIDVLKQYFDEDVFVTASRERLEYEDNKLIRHSFYEGDTTETYRRRIFYDDNGDPGLQYIDYSSGGAYIACCRVETFFNEYHNPDSVKTWPNYCREAYKTPNITIYTYETYGKDTLTVSHRKPFIYPNPAHGIVHIRWPETLRKQSIEIKLYNAAGQEMRRYTILKSLPVDELNTGGLAPGIYLLRINKTNGNEYVYSGKLVIL